MFWTKLAKTPHSGKQKAKRDILEFYKIPTNTGPTKWIVIDPAIYKKLIAIAPSWSIAYRQLYKAHMN